jgi:hypothetical protein
MSQFCVVEGTKISLSNGCILPIENIKAGQQLITFDLQTIQKSQKYDVLVKLKTTNFQGIFRDMPVKNIWKNTVDEYYSINDKLKITGDHIVLAKRDKIYYWTKVINLQIGDYLFTELNIFEKIDTIILIKEKVKVFNLEVNNIYNYFANSYLIHNGAPCSACAACGIPEGIQFEFIYDNYSATNSSTRFYSTHDSGIYIECTSNHIVIDDTAVNKFPNEGSSVAGGFRINHGSGMDAKIALTSGLINAMSYTDSTTNRSLVYEIWFRFDKTHSGAGPDSLNWILSCETGWGPAITLNDPRVGQNPDVGAVINGYNTANSNIGPTPGYASGPLQSGQASALGDFSGKRFSSGTFGSQSFRSDIDFNKWIHIIAEWKHISGTATNSSEKTMWLNGSKVLFITSQFPTFDGSTVGNYLSVGNYIPGNNNANRHDCLGVTLNTIRTYVRSSGGLTDDEATALYNHGVNHRLFY